MSVVNCDLNTLLQTVKKMQSAIDSIETTKSSISTKYQQLGSNWNDKKYKDLGDIVNDCSKSLNLILKTLLQGEKYVALLVKSLQEYENTNLNLSGFSSITTSNDYGSFSISNGPISEKQGEHRNLISDRSKQILGVIDDVQRGSGKQIDYALAEEMLNSIHNYSGDGYSEIRYAYNNPDAPDELIAQLNLVDEYIRNSPKWEGTIYRGINVSRNTANNILESEFVDMLGPSSWSSEESVAQRFSAGDEAVNMVFVLNDNNSGASITHIATYNGGESEVLAPSGIRYAIDNIRELHQNDRYYVYVDVHEL